MPATISAKLEKIVSDIKDRGNVNLTRLTVLKKWFAEPRRVASFAIFIASEASQRTGKTTKEATQLFQEAREFLADVDVLEPKISRPRAEKLEARLEAFQNEYKRTEWGPVRIIQNMNLFLVESGLSLYLLHSGSPAVAYRLAAEFCENYDPRYGNGLSGPSAKRIKEIAQFALAIEAYEEARLKLKSSHRKS
ncbi:MAG TPA: hypothetical protein VK148_10705 [Xanthobacteraceae bacterium]|jgi:hypothetical protein|nr:hypothetical protein [Xanthobacteraceae bacterium]